MKIMDSINILEEIRNKAKKEKERIENLEENLKKDIIISIDLSKKSPGVCIFNESSFDFIFLDSFKSKNDTENTQRNLEILYWILYLIKKYKPYKAILESPFISSFTIKSVSPLLKLHGLIDHFLIENGLKVFEISPSSSRSFLNIKPNKKEIAFSYVKEHFPELDLTNFKNDNDKADAVILALNFNNSKLKKV